MARLTANDNLEKIILVELCKFRMCTWIAYFAKDERLNHPYGGYNRNVIAFGTQLIFLWEFIVQENVTFCC